MVVDLICLANSKKYGGWCVAGLRADGAGFVRPVNPHADHGQLWRSHVTLTDGSFARPLDLLRVPLRESKPGPTQPENWIVSEAPRELIGRPIPETLQHVFYAAVAKGPELLGSRADRISEKYFENDPAAPSLALIVPETLQWWIGEDVNKQRQLRALFRWRNARYSLAITDIEFERRMRRLSQGMHPFRAAGIPLTSQIYLLISLSEPLEGFCYKLVAGIIAI